MSDEILAEASRLSDAAFGMFERGEVDASLSSASRALELRLKVLDPGHLLVAHSYADLAFLLHGAGDEVRSAIALENALAIYKIWLGQLHSRLQMGTKADLLSDIAALYSSLGHYRTAFDYYTFALSHYRTVRDRENEARTLQFIDELTPLLRSAEERSAAGPVSPELVVQTGHTITSEVAFSPDGRLLVTGGSDNMVKLWEVSTGRVLRTLYGAQAPVVFSCDGQQLVTGDARGLVTLWDVRTGERQEMRAIPYERTYPVFAVAISPDGGTLVTGHGDGAVSRWDTALKMATGTLGMHGTQRMKEGHISRETGGEKDLVVAVGNRVSVEGRTVQGVAFSPRGHIVASCGDDRTIKLWSFPTGRLLRELTGHTAFVWDVAFSSDGSQLASSGGWDDKTVRIWDVSTGQILHILDGGHENIISHVAFSPDGCLVAAGSFDMVKVWDAVKGREVLTLKDAKEDVAFSPNGRWLATQSGGFHGNTVTLWEVATGREVRTLGGNMSSVRSAAFSRDVRWLATQGGDSTVLWELGSDRAPFKLGGAPAAEASDGLAFDRDGGKLATLLSGGGLKVWSLATRRELFEVQGTPGPDGLNGWIYKFAFSPDGSSLVTGDSDGIIKFWDAETGQELYTLPPPPRPQGPEKSEGVEPPEGGVEKKSRYQELFDSFNELTPDNSLSELALSPDGQLLASVNTDNEVAIQDAQTGRVLLTFAAHGKSFKHAVNALAFSPDGSQLATGDIEGLAIVWDAATGAALHHIERVRPFSSAHSFYKIERLAFSPDGQRLAVLGGGEATVVDLVAKRQMFTMAGQAGLSDLDWSSDGRFIVTASFDGTTRLWDGSTGEPLVSLVSFAEGGDWLTITPDGLFDGTPEAWGKILWRFTPDTYDARPVESFFNEFFHPGLLAGVMKEGKGKKPQARQEIAQIDRRQPQLNVTLDGTHAAPGARLTSRVATVRVEVSEAPPDENHPAGSGVRDVRLFRNGILVKTWRGEPSLQDGRVVLEATLPVVPGENRLTAYGFNRDNVKSTDASLVVIGDECLRREGTLYVLAVGIDEYSDQKLYYAVSDAEALGDELKRQQEALGNYARIEVVRLLDQEATKANLLAAIGRLSATSSGAPPAGSSAALFRLEASQPEDAVLIYYAGHGAAEGKSFYLQMHGFSEARCTADSDSEAAASCCVSDAELEQALAEVDAGHLLLILDTCDAGQALESDEGRRGPLNAKGLVQLAYEKGMYILAAAQRGQPAVEDLVEEHGFLLNALIHGLKTSGVGRTLEDGQVTAREWFDYVAEQVPLKVGSLENFKGVVPYPRVFYRREPEQRPFVVAKV